MLPGGCPWELSGRKLQRKLKRSQTPGKPRDLQFRGPFLEMFFDRVVTGQHFVSHH